MSVFSEKRQLLLQPRPSPALRPLYSISRLFTFSDSGVTRGSEVVKSKIQVSADHLRDEAGAIDDLAHVLADYFRRTVVVVGANDKEVVVEPRAGPMLDS
jgi:hypothetical protein